MAQLVPELFDFVKAARADARARAIGAETFLLDRIAGDLVERIAPVLREFDRLLDFGTPFAAFAKALASIRPVVDLEVTAQESCIPKNSIPKSGIPMLRRAFSLPDAGLPEAAYALVLSGMTLHRVNDLPGLLIQLRRALRPDGLMIAAFPGGDTLHELRDVLMIAESEERDAAGLRVFPMIDVRAAGQLLQRTGFALPVADSERIIVRYPDLFALIRDLRAMGASAAPLNRPGQPPLTRRIILRAAELYAQRHADPDHRIRATFEMIWISGWAPHESQQKPLKPGSAKMRLADALRPIESGK
jgi:SAM-dependent methyltransferase